MREKLSYKIKDNDLSKYIKSSFLSLKENELTLKIPKQEEFGFPDTPDSYNENHKYLSTKEGKHH
jgi:hypothetical protein